MNREVDVLIDTKEFLPKKKKNPTKTDSKLSAGGEVENMARWLRACIMGLEEWISV